MPLNMGIMIIGVVLSDGAQVISGNCLGRGDRHILNRIFNTTSITALCIDLRVLYENGGITIMLRDNGSYFDPMEWLGLCDNEDPMRCIGVKYIVQKAGDIHYTSTLGLNVIVIKL